MKWKGNAPSINISADPLNMKMENRCIIFHVFEMFNGYDVFTLVLYHQSCSFVHS